MGIYQIEWKKSALRELKHLDCQIVPRILAALEGFAVLEATQAAAELVDVLISDGALPSAARDDAAHVAIAGSAQYGLPRDLELSPHRQCRGEAPDPLGMCGSRIRLSRNMHTRRIDGRNT